jgi:3-dehydroquinate synthase
MRTINYFREYHELQKFIDDCSKLYSNVIIFSQLNILNKSKLEAKINLDGKNIDFFVCDDSEDSKSLRSFEKSMNFLINHKCDRNTLIIGLGGGIVTDFSGFVSSCYMRGIKHILIPTTLLGMVDASIGGKTAINFQNKRNLIGSFKLPESIVIFPEFLKTLDKKEIINGFSEILKYGLIFDKDMFDFIKENFNNLIADMTSNDMLKIIKSCVDYKIDIVKKDFKDIGIRNMLNFGHTIGHAIEMNSKYEISHGESVFYGMKAACYISMKANKLSKNEYNYIINFLNIIPINWDIKFDDEKIYSLMNYDKKIKNGKINLILLDSIGVSYISDAISEESIKESIRNI